MPNAMAHAAPRTLAELRRQLALVRSLVDELDRLASSTGEGHLGPAFREQLMEELTLLGRRILEHAATMTGDAPAVSAPLPS